MSLPVGYKHSKEVRQKISDFHKGRNFSDVHKKNLSIAMKRLHASGYVCPHKGKKRPLVSKALKGRKFSAEHRRNISLSRVGLKLSAEHKKNISKGITGRVFTKEHRSNLSKSVSATRKRRLANGKIVPWNIGLKCPQISEAISGEKHPHWLGGKKPHAPGFTDSLKEIVRNRFNRICMRCFESENGSLLHVHHIDYDKSNHDKSNLVPLHNDCHGKTNYHRDFWKEYFQEIIKMWDDA